MVQKGRGPERGKVDHGRKLTREAVLDLRRLAADGLNNHQLARRFGIGVTTARAIVRKMMWKDVA